MKYGPKRPFLPEPKKRGYPTGIACAPTCMCMCTVCMGSNAGQYRLSGLVWSRESYDSLVWRILPALSGR